MVEETCKTYNIDMRVRCLHDKLLRTREDVEYSALARIRFEGKELSRGSMNVMDMEGFF